jgi:hypothetical protein
VNDDYDYDYDYDYAETKEEEAGGEYGERFDFFFKLRFGEFESWVLSEAAGE